MSEKKNLRAELAFIIEKLDVFSKFIDRKLIKKAVGRYRKLITTPEARFPKLDEIIAEFARHNFNEYAKLAEYEPNYAKEAMKRLYDFLMWPKWFNESYDDIYPPLDKEGKPMMNYDQWYDEQLKEHNRITADDRDSSEMEIGRKGSKKSKTAYKRYVKEWKKKNASN